MKQKKMYFLFIVAIVLVAVVLWFLNYKSEKSDTPTSDEVSVTKVNLHQAAKTLLYLPLYVAIDQGYFKQEGIEVQVVTAGGDSPAFAALASGQAQFAQGDPTFVAISHEKGGPGIVIASVLDRVAFWGVTFDENLSPISDPKGFRGITVVTFPEPNTAYTVQKNLLAKAGLTLGSDSFIIQATFGTELGPVEAGKAQIAMSIEPTVSQAVSQGARVVVSYPDAWGPFLLTGLMTTKEFASKNPKVVQNIVNAYEKSLRLIHENPDEAVIVGQKNFPEVSPNVIRSAISRLVEQKVFPDHALVDIESWKAALQIRVEVGDLKSADYISLVENKYATVASHGDVSPTF